MIAKGINMIAKAIFCGASIPLPPFDMTIQLGASRLTVSERMWRARAATAALARHSSLINPISGHLALGRRSIEPVYEGGLPVAVQVNKNRGKSDEARDHCVLQRFHTGLVFNEIFDHLFCSP